MSVPDVMGCHAIRTRGSRDFVFLDLHIWMAADTRLDAAHEISHDVKDRLMATLPADRRRHHPHRTAAHGTTTRGTNLHIHGFTGSRVHRFTELTRFCGIPNLRTREPVNL